MTVKQFTSLKLLIVIAVAILVSQSVTVGNFLIPVVAMIAAALILLRVKKSVSGVLADERDVEIAGKAALLSIRIFGWIGAVLSMAFFALRGQSELFGIVGSVLSYGVCALLLTFALIARLYQGRRAADDGPSLKDV